MQNDQEIFSDNAAPFNTIKLISVGGYDDDCCCVKIHIVDIAASKESQLSAQSTKSVTIAKQKYTISSIAMSNDTHTLLVANHNGTITQFQKEESSFNYYSVRKFKDFWEINSISLSNSKMLLLSASWDGTLRVWDLQNGTRLACLNEEEKNYTNSILCCCWNDQDTLFASGDEDGDVVVWSPPLSIYNTSNQFIPLRKFEVECEDSWISCLKFQENGLDLFASHSNLSSGVIRLWSINEKELLDSKSTNATLPLIQQPKQESEQLKEYIRKFDVRGRKLAVNEKILSLRLISLQSFNKLQVAVYFEKVLNSPITSVVFSKDGKYVASGSRDGSVAIFDSESGKCVKLIKDAHSDWIEVDVFKFE